MRYAAVIAAAGLSSRMHEFKPLLCLGENTIIKRVIQSLREAGVGEIVVVTGYKTEVIQRHLAALNVRSVENKRFAETKMLDSLKLGLTALQEPYDFVFLMPGDVPLVRPETILQMQGSDAEIVRPLFHETPGHPVLIKQTLVEELLKYKGRGGLRGAIESLDRPVLDVAVSDIGVTMDADTPEDFKMLCRQEMENRSDGQLWPDIQVHIAKGDAILTPETAQFLEMIGHTGSIQSACSCMHMSYSRGWKMLNRMEDDLGYLLVERFPGGVSGGGSVLTEKGKSLLEAYQTYRDELQKTAKSLFRTIFVQELRC